jgi:hypothetical protein
MELKETKYGLSLTDSEGNEFRYIKSTQEGKIVRSEATVRGYRFELDRASEFKGWKKSGRGGVKQRTEVEELLREADSYMHFNKYYTFN